MDLFLWGTETCPYAQRVRIALKELGLSWTDVVVEKVSESPEFNTLYRTCHPRGKPAVPLLQHKGVPGSKEGVGFLLPESEFIVYYLAESMGENGGGASAIMPQNSADRAAMRMFVSIFLAEVLPCIRKIFTSANIVALAEAFDVLEAGCDSLEALLGTFGGAGDREGCFVLGAQFTIAECMTAPHLLRLDILSDEAIRPQLRALFQSRSPENTLVDSRFSSPLLSFLVSKYPRLGAWAAAVLARDSVASTFPASTVTKVISRVTVPWTEE